MKVRIEGGDDTARCTAAKLLRSRQLGRRNVLSGETLEDRARQAAEATGTIITFEKE